METPEQRLREARIDSLIARADAAINSPEKVAARLLKIASETPEETRRRESLIDEQLGGY